MAPARVTQQRKSRRTSSKQSPRPSGGAGRPRRPGRGGTTTRGARAARPYAVALLVALLVGVLALGTVSVLGGDDGPGTSPTEVAASQLARRDADDPLAMGDPDAPVVMIEYADFQDAFVGIHARGTHRTLVEEYVADGVLRIEFRNYPINGPESDAAARAAWAAGQQGRFWEFHDAALDEEFTMNSGRFDEAGLRELAEEAGVPDVARFLADTESRRAGRAVERDAQEAYELGVTSVPSFLVNGEPVQGVQSVDVFRDAVDRALEAAR